MGSPQVPAATRAASVVLAVQCALVLIASIVYVVRLARGEATEQALLLGLLALYVVAAVGLAALAWGLRRGAHWPRTPAVVWNLLLLPVGLSLLQADQTLLGMSTWALAGAAIAGVVIGARHSSASSG